MKIKLDSVITVQEEFDVDYNKIYSYLIQCEKFGIQLLDVYYEGYEKSIASGHINIITNVVDLDVEPSLFKTDEEISNFKYLLEKGIEKREITLKEK